MIFFKESKSKTNKKFLGGEEAGWVGGWGRGWGEGLKLVFFFSKNPNLKKIVLWGVGWGRGQEEVIFFIKNANLTKHLAVWRGGDGGG